MIGLIWRGVRFARGRAVALAAGMLVAALAFSLLTASVEVNAAAISGVVRANWRGAYDLLVLPSGSARTGPRRRVVQVNYLSAAYRGITLAQYSRIAHLAGVGVAAPLAIAGYLLETADVPVTLTARAAGASGARVVTITSRYTADNGLSSFPPRAEGYVYITPDKLNPGPDGLGVVRGNLAGPAERLPDGKSVIVCPTLLGPPTANQPGPFSTSAGLLNGYCFSRAQRGRVQGIIQWSFPVVLAGIDPAAENALTGLGHAVTRGRYLAEGQRLAPVYHGEALPLLASATAFDSDTDQVTLSLLPTAAVTAARSGSAPEVMARSLGTLPGTPVMRTAITGQQAWQALLTQLTPAITRLRQQVAQTPGQYWTAGAVTYRHGPGGHLSPAPVSNPISVWTAGLNINGSAYVAAPAAAADVGFRTLTEYELAAKKVSTYVYNRVYLRLEGEFAPQKLAGFAGRGPGSPLASYRAPLLTGADGVSRRALGNQPFEPDGNMAGYAQQPPLLYTTLAGVVTFERHSTGIPGTSVVSSGQAADPIGSIRVRVSGLRGTISEQLSKIAAVGQEIHAATGLRVVVTAGSSPQQVTIALPAGKFGRPALRLAEYWTATGVALVVLRQADRESLALFVLILVVCGLFLAGAALAGVRGRRGEIGALRALGWGRRQVFTVILGEVVLLGLLAGVVGAALSAGLIAGLGLHLPLWRAAIVLPVAVVLATMAGLASAVLATRVLPIEALLPAARAPRRTGRRVRSVTGLAVVGVTRVPGRVVLAGAGLAVGVAGLTVLLAAHLSFSTSIGDSVMAGLVTASTRTTDLVAVLLTIGLSATGIADLTYLNLRERAGEIATLAASGWGRWQIGRLLTTEALITALAGVIVGAGAGLALAAVAFGLSLPVSLAAVAAGAGGLAVTLAATLLVLVFTSGRSLAAVLAADE